jgi:hypothetical protein
LGRPDALFLPLSLKVGATIFERVRAIAAVAEPLLECDRSAGERAYIRQQPNVLFVTRDPYDTIFFATTHRRAGQPRYRWEKRPGGIEVGYLVEGAELDRREDSSQANV